MSDLVLYNTMSRRKERFEPADPSRVTMYVCGPTVYNYTHIGNARPPVAFDVLFRLLRRDHGAAHVLYARNFTDIDDRIIARAAEAGEEIAAFTQRFMTIYDEDNAKLNVLAPSLSPRATDYVSNMIALIARLIENGAAYRVESGVYFSVATIPEYGKLSGRALDDMIAGARVAGEHDKRDAADFALWKAARPGEPAWETPFGAGRPGWHIECSAMIEATLGETIDIHAGGLDLIFPHHENEIAQSEAAHDHHPLARYWLHNGFITMDSEKMSKSVGNVVLTHELLKEWPGEVIRWALLTAHYRAPLDFTDSLLAQAKASLDRLYGALDALKNVQAATVDAPEGFVAALHDDLNTPRAIAELAGLANAAFAANDDAAKTRAKGELLAAGQLLGVLQSDPETWFKGGDDAAEIDALVAARFAARKAKDFAEADRLRAELTKRGIDVMDSAQGSTWRRSGS